MKLKQLCKLKKTGKSQGVQIFTGQAKTSTLQRYRQVLMILHCKYSPETIPFCMHMNVCRLRTSTDPAAFGQWRNTFIIPQETPELESQHTKCNFLLISILCIYNVRTDTSFPENDGTITFFFCLTSAIAGSNWHYLCMHIRTHTHIYTARMYTYMSIYTNTPK